MKSSSKSNHYQIFMLNKCWYYEMQCKNITTILVNHSSFSNLNDLRLSNPSPSNLLLELLSVRHLFR